MELFAGQTKVGFIHCNFYVSKIYRYIYTGIYIVVPLKKIIKKNSSRPSLNRAETPTQDWLETVKFVFTYCCCVFFFLRRGIGSSHTKLFFFFNPCLVNSCYISLYTFAATLFSQNIFVHIPSVEVSKYLSKHK